jgi:uncharacterized membrane protein YheB (UPF0754 family)
MLFRVLFLAGVGALIGWITNLLAIKLLFKPYAAYKIPVLGVSLQGLIPKRKAEIAKSIGLTIEEELLSIEEIIDEFINHQNNLEIIKLLKVKINEIINNRLPMLIPSAIKEMIRKYVNDVIDAEAAPIISNTMENMIHKATGNINLAEMVERRILDFPMEKLEEVVFRIARKELKHIEILGAVLGFAIGILQGIIFIFQ